MQLDVLISMKSCMSSKYRRTIEDTQIGKKKGKTRKENRKMCLLKDFIQRRYAWKANGISPLLLPMC